MERSKIQEQVVTMPRAEPEPGRLLLAAFPAVLRAARERRRDERRGGVSMPPRYAPLRTATVALSFTLALAIFGSVGRRTAPARGGLDVLKTRAQTRCESRVRSAATVIAAAAATTLTVAVASTSRSRHGYSRYRAAQGR